MKLQFVPFVSTFLGVALALPGQTNATYATGSSATPSSLATIVYGEIGELEPLAPPSGPGVTDVAAGTAPWATLKLSGPAGSMTLLLAHMIPDPSEITRQTDRLALQASYPFLGLPSGTWQLGDARFKAKHYAFQNTEQHEVVIPPERMCAQIDRFLAHMGPVPSYPLSSIFGPPTPTSQAPYARPSQLESSSNLDERFYQTISWYQGSSVFGLKTMASRVIQTAAFSHYHLTNQGSVPRLEALIAANYTWILQVQAVQVTIVPGEKPRIKLSNPVRVRRMSAGALEPPSSWPQVVGARRILPSMYSDDSVSVGAKGHLTEVELDIPTGQSFPEPDNVRCHFPVAGGGWVTAHRIRTVMPNGTNPTPFDAIADKPGVALFLVPSNAVPGTIIVTRPDFSPVPIRYSVPNTNNCGAWFWCYEPEPE